jgi:hypothetical protein
VKDERTGRYQQWPESFHMVCLDVSVTAMCVSALGSAPATLQARSLRRSESRA